MSKNLKMIQTIMKVLRIFTKIAFVACIVGAIFSAVSAALCFAGNAGASTLFDVTVDGKTLKVILFEETGMEPLVAGAYCVASTVICGAGAVTSKLTSSYFDQEIEDGTPFSFETANLLQKVAIKTCVISIAALIIGAILIAVITIGKDVDVKLGGSYSIVSPITMLFASVIFKYGAEVKDQNSNI